jgi:hypothetical protein
MDLYYIILVLFLLVLILVTYCIEDKSVMYFIIIIFLALMLQNLVKEKNNKAEKFTNQPNTAESGAEKLMEAAAKSKEIDSLNYKLEGLGKDIKDLREIVRLRSINTAIEKNAKAENFDLAKSQEQQDNTLDSLEKELDVLLKLYRRETENNDKTKYHSLPIYSSCKVKEEGMPYLRDYNNDSTTVSMLENEELMKNLGIDSKSSAELMTQLNKGSHSDNINFNINLV